MQSLFDIKNPLSFDINIFDKMKKTAMGVLQNAENGQYAQAIVILTTSGKEYSYFVENAISMNMIDESLLFNSLINSKDTEIYCVLCLWQDGGVDIPSFNFRNMLCRLNSANSNTGIFVITKDGPSVIKLGSTLK